MFSAPQIAWHGAGCPTPNYDITAHHGHCATCGAAIDGVAVHIKEIECPTLTQHADFMAHGQHVCPACAWLFGAGKGKPGNFIGKMFKRFGNCCALTAGFFCHFANFICNYGKSLARFACMGGLYCGVHGKEVCLRRNILNDA